MTYTLHHGDAAFAVHTDMVVREKAGDGTDELRHARDAKGNVVAGSLDDAIEEIDVWTFARNVASADPDWLLEETDEG